MGTGLVATDRDKGLPSAQRRGNCLGSSRREPQAREAGCVESAVFPSFRFADNTGSEQRKLGTSPTSRASACDKAIGLKKEVHFLEVFRSGK